MTTFIQYYETSMITNQKLHILLIHLVLACGGS